MNHSCRRVCGGRNCLSGFEDEEHNVYNEHDVGEEAKRLQEKKIAQSNSFNEYSNQSTIN